MSVPAPIRCSLLVSLMLLATATQALCLPPRTTEPQDPVLLEGLTPWRVTGGRLALHLFPEVLQQAGLEVREVLETAPVPDPQVDQAEGPAYGFAVSPESDLLVLRNGTGVYQPYGVLGGAVRLQGGFTLVSPETSAAVDLRDFEVHARWVRTDGPGGEPDPDVLYISEAGGPEGGYGPEDAFRLCYAKVYFAAPNAYPGSGTGGGTGGGTGHNALELRVRAWDLIVTQSLAQRLGRPELAGLVLGSGRILAQVAVHDARWEHPPGQNIFSPYASPPEVSAPDAAEGVGGGTSGIDMQLGGLQSLVVLGHEGVLPTGRTGMALTTISCNVGDVDIPWMAAMDPNHPGIGMALYRELDGRFEQVGVSWIKHGFFAQSNSSCTPCQTPGGGLALGIGCSDTYGSANNGDRYWLGPRSEWNPWTAAWECEGSFFDGTPVDCLRDEDGSTDSSVDHRLEAFDVDLALSGATYWYEAFYMVAGDVDPSNNIGSRRAEFIVDDDGFFATTPGVVQGNPLVLGPAIQRWGQKRTLAGLAPDDGNVILAVQVTPQPGGLWRYEYALFNWSLDRKVDSFSIPFSSGQASSTSFHDIDGQAANDWVSAQVDGNLAWTFPGVFLPGHKVAGPLEFGTLYNFGFISNRPPAVRDAVLGIHEDGAGGDLLAVETFGPAVLALTADVASPQAGSVVQLRVQGGVFGAVVAALSVGGTPLAAPLLITPAPLRFAGGEATVDVPVPAGLSGMDVALIAVEVDAGLTVVDLSNLMTLAVR